MKLIKNSKLKTLCLALLALILVLDARATNWTNYPFAMPGTNDTFLFGVLTTNQFGAKTNAQISRDDLTLFFATNTPILRVVNPLTNGLNYTTPATRGWLTVNVVVTNSGVAWLTNLTTTASQFVGALNNVGTNYVSYYMRVGPNDVVLLTNKVAGVGILSSRWQP